MEELFNKHKELSQRFRNLASIVQNDWSEFPPTKEDLDEYVQLSTQLILEMQNLNSSVVKEFKSV